MLTPILVPGANHAIPCEKLSLTVQLSPSRVSGAEIDISAFVLNGSGKVRGDADMIFYGQTRSGGGEVVLSGSGIGNATFTINLPGFDTAIEKIAFTATIYENNQTFSAFTHLKVSVQDSQEQCVLEAILPTAGMSESALILGEVYRRQGQWKFRAVGQGFEGGLKPLAEHFGVEISTPPGAASSEPSQISESKAIPLSPLILDKSRPVVSLDKKTDGFGEISINLNWHRDNASAQNSGLIASLFGAKTKAIDLDLGCLCEMQTGQVTAIHAPGKLYGSLQQEPYIALNADDQSAAGIDGRWLRINGQYWSRFKRILIYAFNPNGSLHWADARGVVKIYVADEAPLELRLIEGSRISNICAIALLKNVDGALRVNREMHYFSGHKTMDKYYHWGVNW